MTTNDTTLTGPSLSESVACEVMGWRSETIHQMLIWRSDKGQVHLVDLWSPEDDIRQAREVIAEIQRRGLMGHLELRLWDNFLSSSEHKEWGTYLLTCPPSNICRAALAVVREQGEAVT